MIVIPSIDIQNGKCVRLEQGDFNRQTNYQMEPSTQASHFYRQGAQVLHVVDLDGARFENYRQISMISQIRQSFGGILQVGGGIRTLAQIEALLDIGVDRIVLGSLAIKSPSMVQDFIARLGLGKIVLALDFRLQDTLPMVALNGWQETSSLSFWDVLDSYNSKVTILCTDISRDGMESGPAFSFYEEFSKRYGGDRLQASGGVTSLADLQALKSMGIGSVIVGKALYRGTMLLSEAIKCSK